MNIEILGLDAKGKKYELADIKFDLALYVDKPNLCTFKLDKATKFIKSIELSFNASVK